MPDHAETNIKKYIDPVWIKGHAGSRGNEKADMLAMAVSRLPIRGPEPMGKHEVPTRYKGY